MSVMTSGQEIVERLIGDLPILQRIEEINEELPEAWGNLRRRFALIREYYTLRAPEIALGDRFDPYEINLHRFLTPIEEMAWQDIRGYGLPMLMQYPVGRRFVDFGAPHKRIYIELDGKAWHTREKDQQRDAELLDLGWYGYRISGRDSYTVDGTNIIREIARTVYGKAYDPLVVCRVCRDTTSTSSRHCYNCGEPMNA